MNKKIQYAALMATFISAVYLSTNEDTFEIPPQAKTTLATDYPTQPHPKHLPAKSATQKEFARTALRAESAENNKKISNTSDTKTEQTTNTEEDAVAALIQTEGFSNYIAQLSNDTPYKLFHDMEKIFSEEEIDYDWARSEEESFHALFTDTSELNYFVPNSIQCRTTKCQIKLHFSEPDEANKAIELFSKTVKNVKRMAIIATPDFSKGELNLYAVKR